MERIPGGSGAGQLTLDHELSEARPPPEIPRPSEVPNPAKEPRKRERDPYHFHRLGAEKLSKTEATSPTVKGPLARGFPSGFQRVSSGFPKKLLTQIRHFQPPK
jgi:hypothetical protein